MQRSQLLFALGFGCFLTASSACESSKKAIEETQKEVANEVGGAPKRTIDSVEKRVNASIQKGVDRLGENSGVEVK